MSEFAQDFASCPFCGGADIRVDRHVGEGTGLWHRGDDVWTMCCYACGACFPGAYNRKRLKEQWNRRAPKDQPQAPSGLTDERAAFHAFVASITSEQRYDFDSEGRGYKKGAGEMMWLAWQARAALASAAPASDHAARTDGDKQ